MKTGELDTPILTIDSEALDRNITRMKEMTTAAGIYSRPHAKTHKSATIARMQMEAGAVGVCCAKLGEAEVLARLPDGTAVAAREGHWLVTSFHPELTGDSRFHRYFLSMAAEERPPGG